ncbi:hypothetical protein [Schinkia azotoformans]|uniref:hypothetical protein n=1 Tax=Schinkia azotoformans TaxID=1454 RepID=UPI002DB94CCE|nr:hypothetical protein [Schinkia azotoformans]MEC1757398.1 hypothetical protein [Schinkia azotoformans]
MTTINQKQIEKDNNKIIESVMETLEGALLTKPDENGKYKFITKDENGEHVEYKSREVYLQFMIEIAIEELQEHNYFYVKESLDKYEGEM